jgi:hypothetical protein
VRPPPPAPAIALQSSSPIPPCPKPLQQPPPNPSPSPRAACARDELAPLALDAYPEAYPEFKRLLLLLVYRGEVAGQRGSAAAAAAAEWDLAARSELAGMVHHTARQALGERRGAAAAAWPPLLLPPGAGAGGWVGAWHRQPALAPTTV